MNVISLKSLIDSAFESVFSADIGLAKFDAIRASLKANTTNVGDFVLSITLKHYLSDAYSVLDRVLLVLHVAENYPNGLPIDQDVSNVNFWYKRDLPKALDPSQSNAKQLDEQAINSANKAVKSVLGATTNDNISKRLRDFFLKYQGYRYKTTSGEEKDFVALDKLQKSFAQLHYLRNFTTHRSKIVPVVESGWLVLESENWAFRNVQPTDASVQRKQVERGLWIELPDDPRLPATKRDLIHLQRLLSDIMYDVVRPCYKTMCACLDGKSIKVPELLLVEYDTPTKKVLIEHREYEISIGL